MVGCLVLFECPIFYLLHAHKHIIIHLHIHTALSKIIGSFKTSQYHPTSVRISWNSIQEDDETVTGYTLQVEGPDSTQEIPITCSYITSIEISDLRPSTQYTFKVSATGETSLPL